MATIAKVLGIGCYSCAAYDVIKNQLLGLPNLDGKEKIEQGELKDFTDQTARAMGIKKPVELYRTPPKDENGDNFKVDFAPSYFGFSCFSWKRGIVIPSELFNNRTITPNEAKYHIVKNLTHIRRNDILLTHIIPLIVAIAVTILIFPAYPLLALVAGLAVKIIGTMTITKWRNKQTEIATLDHCPLEVKRAALAMFVEAKNIIINARERLDNLQQPGARPQPAWLKCITGSTRRILNWGQPAFEDRIAQVRRSLNQAAPA